MAKSTQPKEVSADERFTQFFWADRLAKVLHALEVQFGERLHPKLEHPDGWRADEEWFRQTVLQAFLAVFLEEVPGQPEDLVEALRASPKFDDVYEISARYFDLPALPVSSSPPLGNG